MDSFAVIPCEEPPEDGVSFLINGRDLMDILAEHGSMDGLLPWRDALSTSAQSVFAGDPSISSERLMVSVCAGCGTAGCSSTDVTVTRTAEAVTWSEFGGQRERLPVGPFSFEPTAYSSALTAGREIIEAFQRENDPAFIP